MATADEHLEQAVYNESVAEVLASRGHFDWSVTTLFYAALHLVQSVLVSSSHPPARHSSRELVMRRSAELSDVVESYVSLRAASEDARYNLRKFNYQEYTEIQSLFLAVKLHVTDRSEAAPNTSDSGLQEESHDG